jgi:UDP-glucose-4-epimerase GalE
LATAGFTPVTYDNLSRGHRSLVRWGPLEQGDIGNADRLRQALRQHRPAAVIHFAAYAYVGESVEDPRIYYRNNVQDTLSLLDVLREEKTGPIIFSSSCATYGVPDRSPISEDTPQRPINPYGRTKLMIEQALIDYGVAYGQKWTALRYFNACGADAGGEIGEMHEPETHLLPRVIMAAMGQIDALDVFGSDYPTPDGTCIRDYIHVTDLAEAHVLALHRLLNGGSPVAVNVAAGRGYSVREVITAVEHASGRKVPVREAPRRPGDPPALVADASKAREMLGFSAQHSDLPNIAKTAWQWHNRRPA